MITNVPKIPFELRYEIEKEYLEYLLLPKKPPNFILSGSYNPKIFSLRTITLIPLPLWIVRLPTAPKIPMELKYENPTAPYTSS